MDSSDPEISFDKEGVCNHCNNFKLNILPNWPLHSNGRSELDKIVSQIKRKMKNKPYDVAIGLSGGLDSSYVAYITKRKLDLRPLAIHVDGGWNSELAIRNIENICKKLDIDLITHVIDWEDMKELQRSFLLSGLANQDVPQDHAFVSGLYKNSLKYGIRFIFSGGNIASESVLPTSWAYNAMDLRHLEGVHNAHGRKKLKSFPTTNFFEFYFWNRFIRRMKVIRPLNYIPYVQNDVIATLKKDLNFEYYGGKHFESRFTKWQQIYFRPKKFGFDERRAYLSSLILSKQISRTEALKNLEASKIRFSDIKLETSFILKKLEISKKDFDIMMGEKNRYFTDYPSNFFWFNLKDKIKAFLSKFEIKFSSNS